MPSSIRVSLDQPGQADISRVFLLTFSWIQFWGVRAPALYIVSGKRHLKSGLSESPVPEGRWPMEIQALFSPSQRINQPISTQHQYLCTSTFSCKAAVVASIVWYPPPMIFSVSVAVQKYYGAMATNMCKENEIQHFCKYHGKSVERKMHSTEGKVSRYFWFWWKVIPSLAVGHLLSTWCLWLSHSRM